MRLIPGKQVYFLPDEIQHVCDFPKVLLTLDDEPDTDTGGIHRRNALEWLSAA